MSRSVTGSECQRSAERFQLDQATWEHGRVINLSVDGACLLDERSMSPVRGGESMTIEISTGASKLTLPVQVRWARYSQSAKGRLLGVQFPPLSAQYRKAIESLARFGYFEPMACAERSAESCSPEVESQTAEPKRASAPASRPGAMPDLYRVLSLRTDADQEQIKAAFRREATRWHPDTCTSPDAAERFMEVSKAYRVLNDPLARERYDSLLRASNAVPAPAAASSPGNSDRRQKGRLRSAELSSNYGPVVNVSCDGLQVLSRKWFGLRRGRTIRLQLHDGSEKLVLSAQIAWMFKAGSARRVGLQLLFANDIERANYSQFVRNDVPSASSGMRNAA